MKPDEAISRIDRQIDYLEDCRWENQWDEKASFRLFLKIQRYHRARKRLEEVRDATQQRGTNPWPQG